MEGTDSAPATQSADVDIVSQASQAAAFETEASPPPVPADDDEAVHEMTPDALALLSAIVKTGEAAGEDAAFLALADELCCVPTHEGAGKRVRSTPAVLFMRSVSEKLCAIGGGPVFFEMLRHPLDTPRVILDAPEFAADRLVFLRASITALARWADRDCAAWATLQEKLGLAKPAEETSAPAAE